jgi:L-fucose mutarotase
MLIGIHELLSADVLHLLARMGHGDDLAVLDGNHPAETIAAATVSRTLIRLPGVNVDSAAAAILTVFPIDSFVPDPVRFMQVVGKPDETPEAVAALQRAVRAAGYSGPFASLERHAFYAAAKSCFGVIQCGEPRFWGNILIRKGAIDLSAA